MRINQTTMLTTCFFIKLAPFDVKLDATRRRCRREEQFQYCMRAPFIGHVYVQLFQSKAASFLLSKNLY